MSSQLIIAASLALLVVVGVLILRELRLARRVAAEPPRRPQSAAPPPAVGMIGEDVEITLFGRREALPVIGPEVDADAGTPSTALTLFEDGTEPDEPTGVNKLFLVWAAGQTDAGTKRRRNEDSILLLSDSSLFMIADGMGGYAGGDVASRLACEEVERVFRAERRRPKSEGSDRPRHADELVYAFEAANEAIRAEAREHPDLAEMGATVVGIRFVEKKQRAFIGHVGDSRCYRWREGTLRLLTVDHTMAARGLSGPMASRVRRALGVSPRIAVDVLVDKPQNGDVYLLCSDGLNKMLDDATIAALVGTHRGDVQACARLLIEKANEAGGLDNISVILVGVRPPLDVPTA